jgi:hypothetical protein
MRLPSVSRERDAEHSESAILKPSNLLPSTAKGNENKISTSDMRKGVRSSHLIRNKVQTPQRKALNGSYALDSSKKENSFSAHRTPLQSDNLKEQRSASNQFALKAILDDI